MSPDPDRLIDLASRPLSQNAELHLAAKAELQRVIGDAKPTAEELDEATHSLARSEKPARRWRTGLYLVTLIVSLAALAHSGLQFYQLTKVRDALYFMDSPSTLLPGKELPASQKLLLFGDPEAEDGTTQWKPLWDSDPDNPAYFAEYANAFFRDQDELSPEILHSAARIDPDNGWYLALSAAGLAEGAVTTERQSPADTKAGKARVWKIDDSPQLTESLDLLHQAMEKPRFTSYQEDLLRQRIPLLPEQTDFISQLTSAGYLFSQPTSTFYLRKMVSATAAGAGECASSGDEDEFHQIVNNWWKLSERLTEDGTFLIDLLVAKALLSAPLRSFRDAAKELGLEEEATRFAELDERMRNQKEDRRLKRKTSPAEDLIEKRASILAALTFPMVVRQVKTPPTLTAEDLRPGRYADHAIFGRAASMVMWALLGLCTGLAALHRYRQSYLIRMLSTQTPKLFRASDWAWILLGGIVFPLLWYLAITRLSPFTAREWSLRITILLHPGMQFASLAVMTLIFPILIANWRLKKRGAMLGFDNRFAWLGWLAAISATLAVPAYGALMIGPANLFMNLGHVLLGIPALWLLVGFCRNILGTHPHALRRATLARIVLPVWIFGMLVHISSIPFYYAEERRWVQRDMTFKITAETPCPNQYEWQVTQALRKELQQTMAESGIGN